MDPAAVDKARLMLLVLGFVFVFGVALLIYGLRRIAAIQRRTSELSMEHRRLFSHVQYRLAAQKEHARAEAAAGAERVPHLVRALALWRLANQQRAPGDDAIYREVTTTIGMIETELRELGVELEAMNGLSADQLLASAAEPGRWVPVTAPAAAPTEAPEAPNDGPS